MRTLRRITLLGSFAAVGVGVAICIGVSDPPPEDSTPSPPRLAVRVVTESDAGLESEPSVPDNSGAKSAVAPSRPLYPPPATRSGPIIVPAYPPYAQQAVPATERARLEEAYEYLRRQLGPAPAGAAGNASTAAAPAAPAVEADGSAAPVTGQSPLILPAPPEPKAAAKPDRAASRAVVDAEGDGKLSIHIQNADLREVLNLLSEEGGLNILAGNGVQGKVSATLTGVDIDSALSAILKSTGYTSRRDGKFIFVGTPDDFTSIEQAMDRIGTRVYRPNYITAAELMKLIQPMLTEKTGLASVSAPAQAGIAADSNAAGGNQFSGGDVIVVRDYQAVLAMVDQLVAEVDVRPLQVHIEAMILSVKLKDTDRYGVNFELLRDKQNIKFGLGNPQATLANFKYEGGALKFGFLDTSLGAFLEALETIGDTNVIATPRLMVINKQRAEIQIGEQKGYVNTTVTETAATQSVQFLDVGALLRLRPFISTDGLIRMEVHPELSDGNVITKDGFTLPEKEVTQVTTNIMVRDGCTVVIGGLMRENLSTDRAQIPVLGNLPFLGFIFRTSTETVERREVLVLITPHIVYEPGTCQEGERAACEAHRRQSTYADKMTPFNKDSIARRYFRLAQSAWAAGDRDTALRFAEMAVHFDPLSRAAIDLRSDIWLGKPCGEHTLVAPPVGRPLQGAKDGLERPSYILDGEQLPDWLLSELEGPPASTATRQHPLDPGQPGRHQDLVRPRRLP